MILTDTVKRFIENNQELLEADFDNFLSKGYAILPDKEFENFVEVLISSKIDFEKQRDRIITNRLGFLFPLVDDGTPLTDFIIDIILSPKTRTFFGLSVKELADFIRANEQAWEHDMYLDTLAGATIIRTDLRED